RQRLLWASTSTKNPAYSDVKYVEALIGPETVNTIPMETLNAYRDHGDPQPRLETNLDEAWQVLDALPDLGIDLEQATDQLEHVGILKFTRSFDRLMESIEQKRAHGTQATHKGAHFNLGTYKGAYDMRLHDLQVSNGVERLWQKDPTLWAQDKIAHAQIRQALGWLHVAEKMKHHLPELKQFGEQVKEERFEKVVHMGMGGSSLAPILFARLFSSMDTGLPVTVLDSTDPEVILGLERSLDLEHTLFIMASKSGETAETLAFGDYFYEKVHALKGEQAGENFVAITDPGSHLVEIGHARRFRKVFLNYADIGGRYSALSFFGLVPAALGGVDVEELLNRALAMVHACQDEVPYDENPGLTLGVALGALALKGRDKVTFVMPETLHPFGMWLEQLLAESTGKQGSGVLPVEGEILGEPAVYGDDRLFVHIDLAHEPFEGSNRMRKLEKAGHPVIYIRMQDRMDLGKEFFRWEFATAVLGSVLRINAFNQPNVQESKDNTERMLAAFEAEGSLPEREPLLTETGIELSTQEVYGDLEVSIAEFLLEAKPGDYIALMAYLPERPEYTQLLQDIRTLVRDWLHTATTLGYGPRFLHSTGQMHKGGPNTGLFIQFSMRHNHDLEIPDRPYTFGVLEKAQYLGDYEALQNHDRRVMRLNLGKDPLEGLKHCKELIEVGSRSLALANRAARRDHMEHRLKEGT
ncbi:MAG: bifunctional transaldolase/phosoglucose isomerase, partial [Anaerolineales bacterium]